MMTVSPTATRAARVSAASCSPIAAFAAPRSASNAASSLAAGETVILMTPPLLSLLKHLIQVEGGAAAW